MNFTSKFPAIFLFLLTTAWVASPAPPMAADTALEDSRLSVTFDTASGALTKLEDKSLHWMIERRPELGASFRLHAPLPQERYNFVLGQKQRAAIVKKIADNKLFIEWKNLVSERGGVLPITFDATVTLENGSLTFDGKLINDSPLSIETLEYPYFGDLNAPARNSRMQVRTMWYGNLQSDQIYPEFRNEKGYWGDFVPIKTFESYRSLFCLIEAPDEGLYVEMKDPTQPYLIEYTFEQQPGVVESINSDVPQQDEISGHASHLEVRATHFLFTHPHSTSKLAPVVLTPYRGDWHAGVDLYKEWRATWFKPPHPPTWVTDVNSWQQLQINSPEQDYRVPYADIIKYGQECARNGVKGIQLVGWNFEGQDGGDPSQDIDPHLGTWQQLHDVIARIQAMGVKMVLFGKLNWADLTTNWYKTELYKYQCTDPFGIPYEQGGYSYYTPTQLAGINNHRRAVMDFNDPAYQEVATREFRKVLALGASGWLFDENCHHGPVKYSFATGHGYDPPGFIYGGDMPMAARFRAAADQLNADFVLAGEGQQDWLMQYYSVSYFRIDAGSTPVARYIDPHAPLMVAVTGLDDREMLNLILLDRYIISYEPYNFKGRLSDFPLTLAYGKKIDTLRRKYKPLLWDADFQDTVGADVNADGAHRYSVFLAKNGKRAVVIVNEEEEKEISASIELPHPGRLQVATPEQPDAHAAPGIIRIPARSAVVVFEQ